MQTYLATLQPLWLKVRWVSGLNQQFAKLPYGITVPGVRIPLSPLEKPGLPESGLFRSPARGELAYMIVSIICLSASNSYCLHSSS